MIQKTLCALLGCLLFATASFAQFQVGTQAITIEDSSRTTGLFNADREIPFDVYYPADVAGTNAAISAGQFPFIVFGHGFGVATTEYSIWYETLAAKGYVIALPKTEEGIFPFPSHPDFAEDLSFIVNDFLAENADSTSFFFETLNEQTAVMGHSMGGGCAWTAAATNSNITTMVTLAAAETTGVSAIANAATLAIPTLTIAGTEDCVLQAGGEPIDMYNNLPTAPYHVYVDIIGASHCQFGIASFASVCTIGETCSGFMPLADQHTQMLLSACDWLDYYLKDDSEAMEDLQAHLISGDTILHNYMDIGTVPGSVIVCPTDLTDPNLGGGTPNAIPAATYQVGNSITSSGSVVAGTTVIFDAGTIVCLEVGFTTDATADFTAMINGCTP